MVLTDKTRQVEVFPHALELADPSATLTIQQAASPSLAKKFTPLHTEIITHGFTHSAYWYRFSVENQTTRREWKLKGGEATLSEITLFTPLPAGGWKAEPLGNDQPHSREAYFHREAVFTLFLEPGETKFYFLRISGDSGLVATATLFHPDALPQELALDSGFFGAFIGIIVIMGLYNLFLFYTLKDRNYLLYVMVIWLTGMFYLNLYGVQQLAITPGWSASAVEKVGIFIYFIGIACHLLFARSFLSLPRMAPTLNLYFVVLVWFFLLGYPSSFFLSPLTNTYFIAFTSTLALLSNLGAAAYVWQKGYRPARYYLLAQVFFAVGGISVSLAIGGWVPPSFWTLRGGVIGVMLEVFLFSLALGDRYRILQLDKEAAQLEALHKVEENITLKKEIQLRTEAESALRQAKETAEAATALKDKFVSLVAHDIRSPFGTILTLAEMLASDPDKPLDPQQQELLQTIQSRGKHLMEMTEQLLNLNRLQTGRITPEAQLLSINELVDEAMMLKTLANSKGISLSHSIPPDARLFGDLDLIREVLRNLVSNAIKFCSAGDSILIFTPDNSSDLAVSDTGQGIPEEILQDIFRHEVKTSTIGTAGETGTGLGLPLSKEIMTAHGGDILVESKVGQGTTITLKFPPPAG